MSSARQPAARMPRAERVESILAAARAAFTEKGFDATTVAGIGARIDVVEGTIYKYFDSKRDLMLAVLARWYEGLLSAGEAVLANADDPRDALHLLIRLHLQAIRDDPLLCRLMFREVRGEHDYQGSALHRMNRRYAGLLTRVLSDGVARGQFRADIPIALLRDTLYGGMEHHSWPYLFGHGALDVDRLAHSVGELIRRGIDQHTTAQQ